MKITFLGATQTVTGSKYLIEFDNKKILVDCGLFQGQKELRLRNWEALPFQASNLDNVILTHAHIDHSGYLPLLVKNGFRKKVLCSKPTADLCSILLPDSGYLQEEEARLANKYHFSKHHPALPLYTSLEAMASLQYLYPLDFGTEYQLYEETTLTLQRAGHILGASFVLLRHAGQTVLFSGDIGRFQDPVMKAPVQIQKAEYIILESTYGNRLHPDQDVNEALADVVLRTMNRGGTLMIPAFAVERAQVILYYLHRLLTEKRIPSIPIYLDSPLAHKATRIFAEYPNEMRLSQEKIYEICKIAQYIHTPEESQALDKDPTPKIIISGSGMLEGGRILRHLVHYGKNPNNTLLLTGYQASGTRGEAIVQGQREVKIYGEIVPINAEVVAFNSLSAHADYGEILQWLKKFSSRPRKVFLVHGELESCLDLKEKIEKDLDWEVEIPEYLEKKFIN